MKRLRAWACSPLVFHHHDQFLAFASGRVVLFHVFNDRPVPDMLATVSAKTPWEHSLCLRRAMNRAWLTSLGDIPATPFVGGWAGGLPIGVSSEPDHIRRIVELSREIGQKLYEAIGTSRGGESQWKSRTT